MYQYVHFLLHSDHWILGFETRNCTKLTYTYLQLGHEQNRTHHTWYAHPKKISSSILYRPPFILIASDCLLVWIILFRFIFLIACILWFHLVFFIFTLQRLHIEEAILQAIQNRLHLQSTRWRWHAEMWELATLWVRGDPLQWQCHNAWQQYPHQWLVHQLESVLHQLRAPGSQSFPGSSFLWQHWTRLGCHFPGESDLSIYHTEPAQVAFRTTHRLQIYMLQKCVTGLLVLCKCK